MFVHPPQPMACPILVVEDDPELREMMATLLTVEGYEPKTAANGREALDQLRGGFTPHVILLDLMMPVMNGWQFRAEQQHDPQFANIPVVIVTALAVNHRQALGAEAVLTKPLDFDRLLNVVRAHC
jgi:CheY-like chemotaxis protein